MSRRQRQRQQATQAKRQPAYMPDQLADVFAQMDSERKSDTQPRCPNCGISHNNAPNWYCANCSGRFTRLTGIGYIDGDGLKQKEAQDEQRRH